MNKVRIGTNDDKNHLQDTHAKGVSQDLVRLIVVTVSDAGCSNEQFKRVILIQIQRASFYFLLQLPHAFLPIAVKQISPEQRNKILQAFLCLSVYVSISISL